MSPSEQRIENLSHWVRTQLGFTPSQISPASEDASFRRYFRAVNGTRSFIVMDAPPEREATEPFVDITSRLESVGVHVPHVHAVDRDQGFVLLDDLGSSLYLKLLDERTVDHLYADAIAALLKIQSAPSEGLADYGSELLRFEMRLFPDWLLERHLGIELTPAQKTTLEQVANVLVDSALRQPQVFVHRDYHSRNLMVTRQHNPGVLDYQDAVRGPLTYDLVSLLRDCYIAWPRSLVHDWALTFRDALMRRALPAGRTEREFLRWFDLMGIQRHLKASGIFARLWRRDGKQGYLRDIPRTLNYILEVAPGYPETEALARLIDDLQLLRRLST
ncbi:MAG: aminoglycoside phosphotransferase family protein [Thiotrichales bacterium]